MKLALIGGAGARVPLVLAGLLRFQDGLRIDEVVLWDVNSERQTFVDRICAAMLQRHGSAMKVRPGRSLADSLEGADFIIASVRVGGIGTRVHDERIALRHGILGQETVGPGGWAMALRTIPVMLEYARQAEKLAPRAWLLNFTNPVGIMLQALLAAGMRRTIGVCDTPRELFESIAAELHVPSGSVFFDYLGLNHLGWVRSALVNGADRLAELFRSPERLASLYHVPLFAPEYLADLKLLPTEYVYFYVNAQRALEKLKRASQTRGEMIAEQEGRLFSEVAAAGHDAGKIVAAYDNFLATRNATYLQLETGANINSQRVEQARQELYEKAAGYERIAVDVMRAIARDQPAIFPVNVANHGAMNELDSNDAVEVPCVIDGNGARPLAVGAVPQAVRSLLFRVKDYERQTAKAALDGSAELAIRALAANPLVPDPHLAKNMAEEYFQAHRPYLDYLK